MKKTQQILTLVLSLGFIAVFAALFWILPDADESTVERRHLAKSPALSFSSVASGSFMNDFENYMLDQFPLRDGFRTLKAAANAKVFIHPDILTCGGALELKKIADIADENGVAVAVHMAESPVACLAAVHTAAAMHNVLALEFHSVDVPWWADMVTGINNPIFENGFIKVPEKPGIGFDELNEEVIKEHINPQIPGYFEPTDEWNKEFSNDRIWS